jgi:hypothetical protein
MRSTWLLLLLGCAHPAVAPAPPQQAVAPLRRAPPAAGVKRPDLHCTLTSPELEAVCAAQAPEKQCHVGAPYTCHGVQPSREVQEEERRQYEESTRACECVCAAQIVKCC